MKTTHQITDQFLSDLAASNLSKAAFARKHGLPPWKLYNALAARAARASRRNPTSSQSSSSINAPHMKRRSNFTSQAVNASSSPPTLTNSPCAG